MLWWILLSSQSLLLAVGHSLQYVSMLHWNWQNNSKLCMVLEVQEHLVKGSRLKVSTCLPRKLCPKWTQGNHATTGEGVEIRMWTLTRKLILHNLQVQCLWFHHDDLLKHLIALYVWVALSNVIQNIWVSKPYELISWRKGGRSVRCKNGAGTPPQDANMPVQLHKFWGAGWPDLCHWLSRCLDRSNICTESGTTSQRYVWYATSGTHFNYNILQKNSDSFLLFAWQSWHCCNYNYLYLNQYA